MTAQSRPVLADSWVAGFILAHGWLLTRLFSGIGETFDGFIGISNALYFGGANVPYNYLKLAKAPLGSLALAPFISRAYIHAGPEAALKVSHLFQIAATSLLIGLAWFFFRRLFSRPVAAVLTVLLAFNPVLLRNSAFCNFDVSGVLFALLFIMSALAHMETPTLSTYLRMLACAAAAFLVKYHQGILILLPPVLAFIGPFQKRRAALLVLSPVFFGLVSLAVLGLLSAVWMRGSNVSMTTALNLAVSANLTGRTASLVYFQEMAYQLGPVLSVLASAGFALWCSRRDARSLTLAAGLGLPILILSTVVKTSESRYTLFILPLVYAAAGASLEALAGRLKHGARGPFFAGVLLAAPWATSYGAVERITLDANFNTRLPSILAQYVEHEAGSPDCLVFMAGEMRYPVPPSPSPMMDNWTSVLMTDNLQFYTRLPIVAVDDSPSDPHCRARTLLVPRYRPGDPPEGGRWSGPELGRLYRWPRKGSAGYRLISEFRIR